MPAGIINFLTNEEPQVLHPLQFGNAKKIQEKLLAPKEKKQKKEKAKQEPKPKTPKERPALTIYKPENNEALRQKQAS